MLRATLNMHILAILVIVSNLLDAKDLIEGLLKFDAPERLSIPEILNHPWLKSEDVEKEEMLAHKDCETFEEGIADGMSRPNINFLNVGNIFPLDREITIAYSDYCYVTNDFFSNHIDEEALRIAESLGFQKSFLLKSIQNGDLNHAAATYNLLTLS